MDNTDNTFAIFRRGRFFAVRHMATDMESAEEYEDQGLAQEVADQWAAFAESTTKKFFAQALRQNFGR